MSAVLERDPSYELRWWRMTGYMLDEATRADGAPWIEDFDNGLIEAWALDLYELTWCRCGDEVIEEELLDCLCGILFYPGEEACRAEYESDMLRANDLPGLSEVPVVTDS